jgi:hypothetical protein
MSFLPTSLPLGRSLQTCMAYLPSTAHTYICEWTLRGPAGLQKWDDQPFCLALISIVRPRRCLDRRSDLQDMSAYACLAMWPVLIRHCTVSRVCIDECRCVGQLPTRSDQAFRQTDSCRCFRNADWLMKKGRRGVIQIRWGCATQTWAKHVCAGDPLVLAPLAFILSPSLQVSSPIIMFGHSYYYHCSRTCRRDRWSWSGSSER